MASIEIRVFGWRFVAVLERYQLEIEYDDTPDTGGEFVLVPAALVEYGDEEEEFWNG